MVDDEVQCRIGVAKLSQRMQQGRHPRIARVNRCGTEPSVSAQPSHVWAKFHRGVLKLRCRCGHRIPVAQACSQALCAGTLCRGCVAPADDRVTCVSVNACQSVSVWRRTRATGGLWSHLACLDPDRTHRDAPRSEDTPKVQRPKGSIRGQGCGSGRVIVESGQTCDFKSADDFFGLLFASQERSHFVLRDWFGHIKFPKCASCELASTRACNRRLLNASCKLNASCSSGSGMNIPLCKSLQPFPSPTPPPSVMPRPRHPSGDYLSALARGTRLSALSRASVTNSCTLRENG